MKKKIGLSLCRLDKRRCEFVAFRCNLMKRRALNNEISIDFIGIRFFTLFFSNFLRHTKVRLNSMDFNDEYVY